MMLIVVKINKFMVTITNHFNIYMLYSVCPRSLPSRTVTAYLEPHSIYMYCLLLYKMGNYFLDI